MSARASVDALVLRAERLRWLSPDATMDALDEPARQWVRDRADEHLAALTPLAQGATWDARVSFTRELKEATQRWDDAWATTPTTPYVQALQAAVERLDAVDARSADVDLARLRIRQALPVPHLWNNLLGHGAQDTLPGALCAQLHAAWLVKCGDAPSPWGPLFDLWERGLWPLTLPDGAFLVYVPIVAHGELLLSATSPRPDPTRPPVPRRAPWDPDPIPVRRPRPAVSSAPFFPRADVLGCGPGPGRDHPLPPTVPQMPLGGAPMPVGPHPMPVGPHPMPQPPPSGAVMPVSTLPVVAPPEAPKPEPWYKRLFR
jgi:hypothetical protein